MASEARARRLVSALLVASTLLAAPALAAPSAAERETARRLMDEGKARSKSGDHARAVEAYQKAHDIMHVPTTGLALARAQAAAGHLVEARDVALDVLRIAREPGEPAVFESARQKARELDAQLKRRIPTVRVKVKGGPATAVTVDGVEIPATLLGEPIAVNPGKRAIGARNADGKEVASEIVVAEREEKELELALPAPAPAAKASFTPVAVRSVDREERPGERTAFADVLVYGGFGVAAAGLTAGTVAGAMAFSKASDVKPQCENGICDPAAEGDLGSANDLATVSTIGFAAAGAGIVLGVVGLLLPRRPAGSALRFESAGVAVCVGPRGVGVRGSFF